MHRITIDMGTTNTRVVLWKSFNAFDSLKAEVGASSTAIEGNNEQIKSTIGEADY